MLIGGGTALARASIAIFGGILLGFTLVGGIGGVIGWLMLDSAANSIRGNPGVPGIVLVPIGLLMLAVVLPFAVIAAAVGGLRASRLFRTKQRIPTIAILGWALSLVVWPGVVIVRRQNQQARADAMEQADAGRLKAIHDRMQAERRDSSAMDPDPNHLRSRR